MINEERLKEIEERWEKTRKGAWETRQEYMFMYDVACGDEVVAGFGDTDQDECDANFCSHSHQDVPDLVAEVRRLAAEEGKLRTILTELVDLWNIAAIVPKWTSGSPHPMLCSRVGPAWTAAREVLGRNHNDRRPNQSRKLVERSYSTACKHKLQSYIRSDRHLLDETITDIDSLGILEDNWDGEDAVKTSSSAISTAKEFLSASFDCIALAGYPWEKPNVSPGFDGGVHLYWSKMNWALWVKFTPDNQVNCKISCLIIDRS